MPGRVDRHPIGPCGGLGPIQLLREGRRDGRTGGLREHLRARLTLAYRPGAETLDRRCGTLGITRNRRSRDAGRNETAVVLGHVGGARTCRSARAGCRLTSVLWRAARCGRIVSWILRV